MTGTVAFCVSCRIALGKLRRTTNVAGALRKLDPGLKMVLLANSGTKGIARSLPREEVELFDRIEESRAADMAVLAESSGANVIVVDTIKVPGLGRAEASLCLILREVLAEELTKFVLSPKRSWDLVILPHPQGHWVPDITLIQARKMESVGWIYRHESTLDPSGNNPPVVLITTGGGGGEDQGNDVRSEIGYLIQSLRKRINIPVKVQEVTGPRDRKHNRIAGTDEQIEPGPELHRMFNRVDLVVATAGYNTVLELACTDVPVLLMPVPRYTDDQEKRARMWGDQLGMCYVSAEKDRAVAWMAEVLQTRRRRSIVDIGPSGATRAAELIRELLPHGG